MFYAPTQCNRLLLVGWQMPGQAERNPKANCPSHHCPPFLALLLCRNHHPLPSELAALQAQQSGPSSSRAGAISPASEDSFGGASSSSSMQELEAPMVKQPPLQV
jgi:hypothetical protein